MKLKELSMQDCEQVRIWRNTCLESLRTPFPLTKEMQEQFYKNVICDRSSKSKYVGIWVGESDEIFIGMCGLENIEHENRRAEISMIINPEYQGKGYGRQAVELLFKHGFAWLNLESIWGECYQCNGAIKFWEKICHQYKAHTAILPRTKYYEGKYYGSMHFTVIKEAWLKWHK
jgi:RimJ/RimL family protein N-acetyltransferase